jgi:hypothetical protein
MHTPRGPAAHQRAVYIQGAGVGIKGVGRGREEAIAQQQVAVGVAAIAQQDGLTRLQLTRSMHKGVESGLRAGLLVP